MKALPLFFLFGVIVSSTLSSQTPAVTLIEHVTVVDVLSGAEDKDQTVRLDKERIISITPASGARDEPSAIILDTHGGYLIPGLSDMHVHVHDTKELPLYLANGVTGIRIMSGEQNTAALRAQILREPNSPQIYLASAIVDGPGAVWPGSIIIKTPSEASKAVDAIKTGGADFIKVYDRLPRDAYFALAAEAKEQQINFAGHVPDAVSAQEASAAGQRSMEHLQGLAVGCSSASVALMADMVRTPFLRARLFLEAEAYRTLDPLRCEQLLMELRQNDTWQVPTLTANRMWGHLDDRAATSDARLQYIDKASRRRWANRTSVQMQRWSEGDYSLARAVFAADERLVGLLYRSGVPLMAGTDAMNPFCFPGFSLHDELALLVESGVPPLATLQMATISPARFLNRETEEGSVTAGKVANLVLLDADPLSNIRNTTQIQGVWLRGYYYNRAALTKMLETASK